MVEEKRDGEPIAINWSALSAVIAVAIAVTGSFVKTEIDMSAVQADLRSHEGDDKENRDAIAKLREALVEHTGSLEAIRARIPRLEQQVDIGHAERVEHEEAFNKRLDLLFERMTTMVNALQAEFNQVIDGDASKPKR